MPVSLLLPLVYNAHGAAQCVIAYLQRVAPCPQRILPIKIVLFANLLCGGLQSRVGVCNVGLRNLYRCLLPYFQRPFATFRGLRVVGSQLPDGTECGCILFVAVKRVDTLHGRLGYLVGRRQASIEADKRCKEYDVSHDVQCCSCWLWPGCLRVGLFRLVRCKGMKKTRLFGC